MTAMQNGDYVKWQNGRNQDVRNTLTALLLKVISYPSLPGIALRLEPQQANC